MLQDDPVDIVERVQRQVHRINNISPVEIVLNNCKALNLAEEAAAEIERLRVIIQVLGGDDVLKQTNSIAVLCSDLITFRKEKERLREMLLVVGTSEKCIGTAVALFVLAIGLLFLAVIQYDVGKFRKTVDRDDLNRHSPDDALILATRAAIQI